MINFLFTTSSYPFSKITRWGLETDCSHFAIVFNIDRPSAVVFHSDFMGVRVDFYQNFVKKNKIIHNLALNVFLTETQEDLIFRAVTRRPYKKGYDIGAYLFWTLNIIGNKLFGFKIAKKNLWQSNNSYLCTELYSCLSGLEIGHGFTLPRVAETSMIKPHDLFHLLSQCMFFMDYDENIFKLFKDPPTRCSESE